MGNERELPQETSIQSFYKDAHVFITGGTGFLGKAMIEKLLRSCPQVSKLYLLIRCKKGKTEETRLKELFDDPAFQVIKKETPNFLEKVVLVTGDVSLPGLGLSDEHKKLVEEKVTIVFHGAATVRFDENLKVATAINICGTKEIIKLCHDVKNLKSLVHVSTAYCNCNQKYIEEKFYEPPSCTSRLMEMTSVLTVEELNKLTPDLLENWPNTYTLTKAIAEHLVKHEEGKLPVCVFRPAIVTSSYQEPLPGWCDNVYGPTGLTIGAGLGLIKVIHADISLNANLVPVDLVTNALLACAKETYDAYRSNDTEIKIYNYVSVNDNPLKWGDYKDGIQKHGIEIPSIQAVWYYSLSFTKFLPLYSLMAFFLHFVPAYIIDGIATILGQKPQLVKVYTKISNFTRMMTYFSVRSYEFGNSNTRDLMKKASAEDKKIFPMDLKEINWDEYLRDFILGARLYIVKDPVDTLPQARIKWRRLYWLHQLVKAVLLVGLARLFYVIFNMAAPLVF